MNYYLFILFLNLLFNYSFAFTPNILFNNWNCIGIKENINFNKPYTIKVGDLPLVIWKNKDNQVVSAINICKHLGSSFDDGSISNDGCLVCPYHGLKYNSQDEFGKVIEQDGKLFWSHNPKNNKPPSFPMYNNKKYKKIFLEFEIECSLQDSAYNSLDIRHPAFVHNSIIGFGNNNPPKNIKTYNYKNKDMIGLSFIYKSNKIIQYINSNSKYTDNIHLFVCPSFTWSKVSSGKNNHLYVGVNFLPIAEKKTKWFVTIVHNYNHMNALMMKSLALPILLQDKNQLKHQYVENELKKIQMLQYKFPDEDPILFLHNYFKNYKYPDSNEWASYIKNLNKK